MKITALIMLLLFNSMQGIHAQAKQRKELLLQIAALKVYAEYAQKGYSTVKKGLQFIGDLKKGEVGLHGDYFTSLLRVNTRIKSYYKVAEIISLQVKIIKEKKRCIAGIRPTELFYGDELSYIQRSFDKLIEHTSNTLEELLAISTNSGLGLKDDQRIERIDALHEIMLDDYHYCISLSKETKLLSALKSKESREVHYARILNGL